MKLLFFMLPAHGHMNPTLPVAKELIRRGEKIVYYTTREFAAKVTEVGAEVRVIDNQFGMQMRGEQVYTHSNSHNPEMFLNNLSNHIQKASLLLEQVRSEDADGAVCDTMCLWGRTITEQLHMRRVLFYSGIVITPDSSIFQYFSTMFQGRVPEIIRKMFMVKEELNIAPIPREFQPDSSFLDDKYKFIGPTIIERGKEFDFPVEWIKDHPTIYISLGSIINNPLFYQMCIEAFADTEWKVVMVAKQIPKDTKLPSNFLTYPFVPQLDVLKHADLFISHGGMNSVMESLWFGVPLILVPQSSDQPLVAARVEELGLGLRLDSPTLTPEQLKEAVEQLNDDQTLKKRVKEMQSRLHKYDGSSRGADILQRYFNEKQSILTN